MAQALDYSAGAPSGAAVRTAGYVGVVRYCGTPGRPKNITRAEYEDMDMSGVGVALVYENRQGDALSGFGAGQASARAIQSDAASFGFPSSRPFYFTVDQQISTEAQYSAVMAYLDGAATVVGHSRVGVYGQYGVVQRAIEGGHAAYGWQTVAWSAGLRYSNANLFQNLGYVYVDGVECDSNDILSPDWGQHNYGGKHDMENTDPSYQDLIFRMAAVIDMDATSAGPSGGVNKLAATLVRVETKLDALTGALTDDQAAVLAAIKAQPTGGQVDVPALAKALAPMLPPDATPDQIATAVRTAFAAHLGGA